MIILGIDPGLTRTGYGVVEKNGPKFIYKESGIFKVSGRPPLSERLAFLKGEVDALFARISPDRVGVEKIFFSKNVKTALDVAQARGVVLSLVSGRGAAVFEIAPTSVKAAIAGDGHAEKAAVAKMLGLLLNIKTKGMFDDATDALAVAVAVSGL